MGKTFKNIAALGAIGGLAFGGLKAKQHLDYLKEVYNEVFLGKGERIVYDDIFEGDSLAAIGSGLEIDMSEMTLEEDLMTLDLYGLGAGIKLVVPEGIHIVCTGSAKGSGVEINVAEYENDDILTLNINYDLKGSGLLITTKYDDYEEYLDEEDESEDNEVELSVVPDLDDEASVEKVEGNLEEGEAVQEDVAEEIQSSEEDTKEEDTTQE